MVTPLCTGEIVGADGGIFVGAGSPVGTTYSAKFTEGGIELSVQLKVALLEVVVAVIPVGFAQGGAVQLPIDWNNTVNGVPSPGALVYNTSKNGLTTEIPTTSGDVPATLQYKS